MQHLSLNHLQKLIPEGAFMPPQLEGPPELSRTTAILLVFQADSQHEEITDVYVGLIVHRVESHLYTPDQILDFIKDIEVDLQVVLDTLKARGDPSKRRAFCLFVSNSWGAMFIPTDLPYCLHPYRPALLPLTPTTTQWGHTCVTVSAVPLCISTMVNLKSAQTTLGTTSSCPVGLSTMTGSSPQFSSCRITRAN